MAADLIVIPTHDLAYPTGQSVLLEGMSSGRPVVVTRTAAMAEYIEDGVSNFSMPLHDPVGVASVIAELLADPKKLEEVGKRAREVVESRYTFQRMWREISGHLRHCADRSRG
ncbi:glycosyltransferase [Pseudoclavibacter sp. JSM 162008]|uniref:glycosyltransferase n=1 Tax=Pseudoclavibacter sp. JSM 162008 TaxID=3229855 RepID=UPI0035268E51